MRDFVDLSPVVRPGDTVYVALLKANGRPAGTGYQTTIRADGSYTGQAKVAAGRARIDAVNRPGRRR